MTFRRSNQKPRTKKSHVMEQIFLSLVKNTKNSQRIREDTIQNFIKSLEVEFYFFYKFFMTILKFSKFLIDVVKNVNPDVEGFQ